MLHVLEFDQPQLVWCREPTILGILLLASCFVSLPSAWAEATSYKPIYTGSRPRPCGSTKARNANPIIEATYQTNLLCRTGAHFCTGLLKLCPQRSPFLTPYSMMFIPAALASLSTAKNLVTPEPRGVKMLS